MFPGKLAYSYSCLPAWHISGLMPWVRSAIHGGRTIAVEWKSLELGRFPMGGASHPATISLVPTQLAKLMQNSSGLAWLKTLSPVLLGGAACDISLLKAARDSGIKLCQVYGATETAAAVAASNRQHWQTGSDTAMEALAGIQIDIEPKNQQLSLAGEGLHHGYWPDVQPTPCKTFATGDRAELVGSGQSFRILGRQDSLINTGGEKVDPQAVAQAILAELSDGYECHVFGISDALWGQRVVAAIAPELSQEMVDVLKSLLKERLARWEVPKRWLSLKALPRSELGKIDQEELLRLLG